MTIVIRFPHQKLKLKHGHLKKKIKNKKDNSFYFHQ